MILGTFLCRKVILLVDLSRNRPDDKNNTTYENSYGIVLIPLITYCDHTHKIRPYYDTTPSCLHRCFIIHYLERESILPYTPYQTCNDLYFYLFCFFSWKPVPVCSILLLYLRYYTSLEYTKTAQTHNCSRNNF